MGRLTPVAGEALYWLAAAFTATWLWGRTGIGVFIVAAWGFMVMVRVWALPLFLLAEKWKRA